MPKLDAPNANPFACLGCLMFVVSAILVIFVLTHVGPIWQDLTRIVGQ